jgi:hypothetical protein
LSWIEILHGEENIFHDSKELPQVRVVKEITCGRLKIQFFSVDSFGVGGEVDWFMVLDFQH